MGNIEGNAVHVQGIITLYKAVSAFSVLIASPVSDAEFPLLTCVGGTERLSIPFTFRQDIATVRGKYVFLYEFHVPVVILINSQIAVQREIQ